MKHYLRKSERNDLEQLIKDSEAKTGAQMVIAVIGKCDHYPEIPWKAFSSGVVLSGLLVLLISLLFPVWVTGTILLYSMAVIFGTGLFLALITVLIPGFARIFLSSHRGETESLQYAESLFLNHEHFATAERNGILIMVCQFERQVVILPDKGISRRLGKDVIESVIQEMKEPLKEHRVKDALAGGLNLLTRILATNAPAGDATNTLSDKIIEEEGV